MKGKAMFAALLMVALVAAPIGLAYAADGCTGQGGGRDEVRLRPGQQDVPEGVPRHYHPVMLTRRGLLHRLLLVFGFEPVPRWNRTGRLADVAARSDHADAGAPASPL